MCSLLQLLHIVSFLGLALARKYAAVHWRLGPLIQPRLLVERDIS